MPSSDLDSAEDTAATAPNDAEGEVQEEDEEDSPAESNVLEEEVGIHMPAIHYLIISLKKTIKNMKKNLQRIVLIT